MLEHNDGLLRQVTGNIGQSSSLRFGVCLVAITAVIITLTAANAGDTWDGGGANDNWTTGNNWNGIPGFQFPPPNNGTANLTFPSLGGLVQTPIIDVPYSINSLTFNNGDGRYVILGAAELTIGGGGILNNDADIQSIMGTVKLAANQAWTANAARLQVDAVDLNGFDLTVAGAYEVDVLSIIVGSGGVTIADTYSSTSTMLGGASNTYTGLTDVQGGTLTLQKSAGVAVPGDLSIGSGATLLLAGNEQIAESEGNEVTIHPGGLLDAGTHVETLALLNLAGSVAVDNGGSLTAAQIQVAGTTGTWLGRTYIGDAIDGSLVINNGGSFTDGDCYIANSEGAIGTATVSGPGSHWNSTLNRVGYRGDGSLLVDGGATGGGYTLTAGALPGSIGTIAIDGPGSKWIGALGVTIGWSGSGQLSLTDGGEVLTATSMVGYEPGSTGSVTIEGPGSTWFSTANMSVGWEGDGTMEIFSGASLYSEEGRVGAMTTGVGEVNIDGPGSKWVMNDVFMPGLHGQGAVNITGGGYMESLWATVGDWPDGTGTVTVDGPGSTWMNAGNLFLGYSGTGSLTVTNDATVEAANVIVGALASIHGDGEIVGNVENGGVVSPGSSAGTLHIDGNFTQLAEAELLIELESDSAYDQVIATGSAAVAGTLTVDLLYLPSAGKSFTILTAGSITGRFAEVSPSLFNVVYTPTSVVLEIPGEPCSADIFPVDGGDGAIGPGDLGVLLASWGPCPQCDADLTGDETVGPADLAQLLASWGACE